MIFNEGLSWAPEHYADDRLKKVLHELVDSADNTGCAPDLTVGLCEARGGDPLGIGPDLTPT